MGLDYGGNIIAVQASNLSQLSGCKDVPDEYFRDQRLQKTLRKCLLKAVPQLACYQPHTKVDNTAVKNSWVEFVLKVGGPDFFFFSPT